MTCVDDRDRRDRVEVQTGYWETQSTRLVHAYLKFRALSNDEGMVVMPAQCNGKVTTAFTIQVVDTFCKLTISLFLCC